MTQQEVRKIGTDAVRELDFDFHLDSAEEHGSQLCYHFTNHRAAPDHRMFEIDVDLKQTGPSVKSIKAVLRHELEFAAHHV